MSRPSPTRSPLAPRLAEGLPGEGPASVSLHVSLEVFRAACEAHLDFVWRFASYRGVSEEALPHVVHKVFGVIHGRLVSLSEPTELRISVAGITRNVVRTYLRQIGQLGDHSALEPSAAPNTLGAPPLDLGPVIELETKTPCELCDLILSKMTETEREVFILCEIEGFTLTETAEALHIGENTLRVRLDDACKIFNVASAELRAQRFWTTRQAPRA
jgi:DNA-directed RNA polymerase specialized sigma24 family protein